MFELSKHRPDGDWAVAGRAQPGQRGNENSSHGTLMATWVRAHIERLRHGLTYRAQSLSNAPRTRQLLQLMVPGRSGQPTSALAAAGISWPTTAGRRGRP